MKNIIKRIGSMILAFTICFSTHGPIEVYADTPEEWNYSYEDIGNSYETWVCPENGIYKFEVWGASGGGCESASGYYSGGYTWITIKCHTGDKYYIYCGQQGENNASINAKTYGDGGAGLPSDTSTGETGLYYNASGGGATSIRSTAGAITENYDKQVLVAGGGAGKCNENNIVNDYLSNTLGNNSSGSGSNSFFYSRYDSPGNYKNTGRATAGQGGGFAWSGKQLNDTSYNGQIGGSAFNNENYLISSGGQGYINPGYTIDYKITPGGNLGHGRARISYVEPIKSTITFECGEGNSYNGHGDASGNYSITKEFGETITLEKALRSGWSFTHWTNTSDTSQTKIYEGDTYTFGDDDVIFKPHFIYDGNATFYAVEDLSDTTDKVDHYIHVNNIDDGLEKYIVFQTSLDGGVTWQSVNSDGFSFDESQANKRFNYTGNYQVYTVPATGYYQLFAKGGDGGKSYSNQSYGTQYGIKGNDISGKVKLNYGEKLYVYVGAAGVNGGSNGQGRTSSSFGWGTGGGGYNQSRTWDYGGWIGGGGGGGGATTFALSTSNVSSRLLVAGGGAGAGTWADDYNGNPCYKWELYRYPWDSAGWGFGGSSSPNGSGGNGEKFHNGNDRRVSGGGGGGWTGGKEMRNGISGYMSSRVTDVTQGFGSCVAEGPKTITSNFANPKSNGYATLKFLDSDVSVLSFDADFKISPYDMKAPDEVSGITLSSDINNENNIVVSWEPSSDNGDNCLYKAEIFNNETKTKLYDCEDLNSTSNPKSKTISVNTTSGTKGYYYYVDANAANSVDIKTYVNTNITNGGNGTGTGVISGKELLFKDSGNEQHIMARNNSSQYIHICSVDYAGNISNTKVFEIPQGAIIKFNKNDTDKNLSGDDCTVVATGTMPQQVITFGSTTELSENAYVKHGYTFVEWNTKSDGTGVVFTDKQTVSYQELSDTYGLSLELYAQWKPIEYDIYYEKGLTDNGGGGTTNKTTHNYDSNVTLASNGFTGMDYKVSYNANKPSNAKYEVENMPTGFSGKLQFDKWAISSSYNSGTYDANTNLGVKNFESTNGATATATAFWKSTFYTDKTIPTLKDWDFIGWSQDKTATNGDTFIAADIHPSISAYNVTWYALWKPHEYTIVYVAPNATNVPTTQTKYADTSITLSSQIPSRDYYVFVEWNTEPDGSGTTYNPSQKYDINEDLTLYAIFDGKTSDGVFYSKGLTNDIEHTAIALATRNTNIQSLLVLARPYTKWKVGENIKFADIGDVLGRNYNVNFEYNVPNTASNNQRLSATITNYENIDEKTTYKFEDYLKFNKWMQGFEPLFPEIIEPNTEYEPLYKIHHHTGNSTNGGGCYTVRKTRTISYTVTCGCSSCWCEGFNGISDNWNCTKCGHGHMGPHGDGMGTGNGTCTASKTKYSTVVYYELGCGKTEGLRYVSDGIEKYIIKGSVSDTGKGR